MEREQYAVMARREERHWWYAGMRRVAGMPDLHPGRGYPVGAAFFSLGRLYPALIGGDIGWDILPTLSARLGYSGGSVNYDVDTTDVRYNGKLKLSNVSGLIDFSPFGPFRVTAGLMGGGNKIDVTGTPAAGGSLHGTVKPGNQAAPYLGFGYGNVAGAGVNFYFDIGVMFQGSPKVTLTADCTGLSGAQCTQLQNTAATEKQRLQDKLDVYKYYPVVNVGITIGF